MNILLDPSVRPPLFRFSNESGGPVKIIEVRVMEVGETAPSWWLVHDDGWIEDAVALNILTSQEAEAAGVPTTRVLGGSLETLVAGVGVPLGELRYGQVPAGFRQHGSLRELKSDHLYSLLAVGPTLGELEFYG